MPRKQRKKYSFPLLKTRQIIVCMNALGIELDNTDLNNPREDRFKFIYASVLESLLKINLSRKEESEAMASHFLYPQLHEKSVTQIRLVRTLIRFMQRVGVKDFSISDLISPEKSRTIRNLSGIINFAKFRNQKCQLFSELCNADRAQTMQFTKMQARNQTLGSEFVRLQQLKTSQEPEVIELESEIADIHARIGDTISKSNAVREVIHDCKKKLSQAKVEMSENRLQLDHCLDEIRTLESQIVRSPQKLKKRLSDMNRDVEKRKIEMGKFNAHIRYLQTKLRKLSSVDADLEQNIAVMQQIAQQKQLSGTAKAEYKSVCRARKQSEQQISKLRKEELSLAKKLEYLKKNLAVCEQNCYQTKQEINRKLKQMEGRQSKLQVVNDKYVNQIRTLKEDIGNAAGEAHHWKEEHDINQNLILAKYQILQQCLGNYQQQMSQGMQQITTDVVKK
jgi:kinetochore protein Nuf2